MSIQKSRSLQKYQLCDDFGSNGEREWFPVPPWESHASHFSDLVDRQFGEAMWTCGDGLLVYPPPSPLSGPQAPCKGVQNVYTY